MMKKLMIFFLLVCSSGCTIDRRVLYINDKKSDTAGDRLTYDRVFNMAADGSAALYHMTQFIKTLLGK
jgi:hypothetical protein